MHTRKDYLDGRCSHREYYAQFVNQARISRVVRYIGGTRIMASTDAHLNDIPLSEWDHLVQPSRAEMAPYDDFPSIAGGVCIAKEAARQYKESGEEKG